MNERRAESGGAHDDIRAPAFAEIATAGERGRRQEAESRGQGQTAGANDRSQEISPDVEMTGTIGLSYGLCRNPFHQPVTNDTPNLLTL